MNDNSAEINPKFSMYQENISHVDQYYCGDNSSLALRSVRMENTPLSELYFSKENIKRIQNQIKKEIFRLSNKKFKLVVDQDESDLLLAMRAVFLDNANHLPTHIVRQVKDLNKKLIDYIIPDMITNIKQHNGYIKEINKPIIPLPQPINVNNAGRKTLPSFTSIW